MGCHMYTEQQPVELQTSYQSRDVGSTLLHLCRISSSISNIWLCHSWCWWFSNKRDTQKMRMPKKFGKIYFSSSVARRPTINFFLWHFNKLLLEAELFTEFEFASFSGWRSTKRSRKFWGAALDQTHAHLLSSGMLLASQAIPQNKFTSFDSCRNNQEKVPNLGVFVHSYYSNSWDFRHPSKAK